MSHLEWLREAQKGYVVKTLAQQREEMRQCSFSRLCQLAGPPPNVSGCDFEDERLWAAKNTGELVRREVGFNSELAAFKRREGPPPAPLPDTQHVEARVLGVTQYNIWFSKWGDALYQKWCEERSGGTRRAVQRAAPKKQEGSCGITVVKPPPPPPPAPVTVAIPVSESEPVAVAAMKPFEPTPAPKATAAEPFADIAVRFRQMCLADPIFDELRRDRIAWGDIDLYDEGVAEWEREYNRRAEERRNTPEPEPEQKPEAPTTSEPIVPLPTESHGIKTIIARNLPRDITVEHLRGVFERFGPIKDIYIPKNMDRQSAYFGTIKGFALIKFISPSDSAKAYQGTFGRLTFGRNNITVEFAKQDR